MASIIPDSQLDNDIATIRSQIESLRHRKSLLSNTLLSSHKTQRLLHRAKESNPSHQLNNAIEIKQTQCNTNTSNLYHSLAGITAFRVQDPDPNAIDNGRILGVRIDVFSTRMRKFRTPYYILLNQPEGKEDRLRVHRHTIPACVSLKALIEKYLPYPEDGGDNLKGRPQDLGRFVRAVRRECVGLEKRVGAVEGLRAELGRAQGIGEVRGLDKEGREAEIEFLDKYVARISIGMDGVIEKVFVRNGTKGGASVRGKAIERMILAGDGRIESLVARVNGGAQT